MKIEKNLPENWIETELEEISDPVSTTGKKIKTKDALPFGRYPVIDQGIAPISGYINDPSLLVTASIDNAIVIFGDHTRIVKYVTKDFVPGADGTKLISAKNGIYSRYLKYLIQQADIPDRGYGRHYQFLKSANLPLAPENEQRRIADKLDTVLTRVDALNDRLARIAPLLKRFRQSVLAAATSGRLTEDWRISHSSAKWSSAEIQNVAHVGTGSTPLRSNPDFFATSGTPWVTSSATSEEFVKQAEEHVTSAAIAAHRLKIYPVGTLLVAMYGEGKTRGQVTELKISAAINQACAAVIVDETKISKQFVKLSLQANYLEMRTLAEGGNQPNLNLSKVKSFAISVPSQEEQTEIVRRVEILFAYADRLEARLQTARTAADRLTPALLAKAFRGELVPQDPNDEPATELLRRLREARAAQPSAKKARGSKAAAGTTS